MIVPNQVSPIEYDSTNNMFIFITQEMILRVNYQEKRFDLEMPNQTAYHRSFDYVLDPEDWFESLDFGLVEWIRQAIDWEITKSKKNNEDEFLSFTVEGKQYKGKFNARTNMLKLKMPSYTIISQRDCLVTDFPELQFMEFGKLITELTTEVILSIERSGIKMTGDNQLQLPVVFNPKLIRIDENNYQFDYLAVADLALLMVPERELCANLLIIESELPELAEMHQGMMFELIRSVVYDQGE